MTTTFRPLGHKTLTLKQLAPAKSASFSPNLYRWMRAKAHFYGDGGVLQTVYRVKPDTQLAQEYGAGTLMIGYPGDSGSDQGFVGVRLMAVLCQGVMADSFYYLGMTPMLEEVDGFWDTYLKIGRCAIDPAHLEHFQSDRFREHVNGRECLWCGHLQRKVVTSRVVHDTAWVAK
jgi:hypothetical protein